MPKVQFMGFIGETFSQSHGLLPLSRSPTSSSTIQLRAWLTLYNRFLLAMMDGGCGGIVVNTMVLGGSSSREQLHWLWVFRRWKRLHTT